MFVKLVRILIILALFSAIDVFAESNPVFTPHSVFSTIEEAYTSGSISLDDKVILQINAIKYPEKLPLEYRSVALSVDPAQYREATLALIDIRLSWDDLNDKTKQYVTMALARVTTAFIYVSPGGYFTLHYDTVGTNAVPTADTNSNSIPDFIEKCAAYCDSSLARHQELGYLMPPNDGGLGGDTLFDVYFEDMSYYGYAVPEGPGAYAWNDYYSYLVLNNDFLGFPSNNDPEGQVAGAAKVTVAHEFHHCVQFAYDVSEGSWYMELDATYFEDITFDQVDDNYNYLPGFFDAPYTSLMDNSPGHKYASFIWNTFLAEKFDTSLNVAVWEGARYSTIYDTFADTLMARYNWTADSAFVDFTYWNFCTDFRDDGLHYEEASQYPPLAISATYLTYPVPLTNSSSNIAGYGASYITFYPGTSIGKLRLTFNGSNTRHWKAYIIKSSTANSHDVEFITLDPVENYGEIIIPEFENYYSVTLVGVNIDEFSSGVKFTYSASIILPYEVTSDILTTDSAIYSGGSRAIEYQVKNPATINDLYRIIYWDDNGWLPIDTYNVALASGESTTVSIDVTPPQGTPLNDISVLNFKAESWGDTTVYDQKSKIGKIFLQRGDVDFSGTIDIADIVYFVTFSFGGGPAPQPVLLAADFDCSNDVNISDIVALVDYAFNDGPYCPCNPY